MTPKEEIDQARKGLMGYDDYSLVVMGNNGSGMIIMN